MFPNEKVEWQKNKLGWGHSINHLLANCDEKYVVIMDPSTNFTGDAITPVVTKLDEGFQGVGWRGGLVNVEDEWRSVDDRGIAIKDAGTNHGIPADAHKKSSRLVADQLFIEIDPPFGKIIRRSPKASGIGRFHLMLCVLFGTGIGCSLVNFPIHNC